MRVNQIRTPAQALARFQYTTEQRVHTTKESYRRVRSVFTALAISGQVSAHAEGDHLIYRKK